MKWPVGPIWGNIVSTENASIKMILIITLMVRTVHFSPLVYSQHTVNSATSGEEVVVEFRSELRRTLLLSTSIQGNLVEPQLRQRFPFLSLAPLPRQLHTNRGFRLVSNRISLRPGECFRWAHMRFLITDQPQVSPVTSTRPLIGQKAASGPHIGQNLAIIVYRNAQKEVSYLAHFMILDLGRKWVQKIIINLKKAFLCIYH